QGQRLGQQWRWTRFGNGLPNVQVSDLQVQTYGQFGKYLFAATYGRGVWRIPLEAPVGQAVTLAGRVWNDLDGDGQQGINEPGVPAVFVTLFADDGSEVETQKTDDEGAFEFQDEPPGTYQLRFSAPAGYGFT